MNFFGATRAITLSFVLVGDLGLLGNLQRPRDLVEYQSKTFLDLCITRDNHVSEYRHELYQMFFAVFLV